MYSLKFLEQELNTFETYIDKKEELNIEVSSAPVKWHLMHILLVINGISKAIYTSKPSEFQGNFNLKRSILFIMNKIPRGKGKAPEQVKPDKEISNQKIIEELQKAKLNLKQIDNLDEKSHFKHPFFGVLNKRHTIKFLELHTTHHIKIIKDIINKKRHL